MRGWSYSYLSLGVFHFIFARRAHQPYLSDFNYIFGVCRFSQKRLAGFGRLFEFISGM